MERPSEALDLQKFQFEFSMYALEKSAAIEWIRMNMRPFRDILGIASDFTRRERGERRDLGPGT